MPRNVRNFWIEGYVDGRSSEITGGPKQRFGGMEFNLYQRNNGEVEKVASIMCFASSDGVLRTYIEPYGALEGYPRMLNRNGRIEITTERG
jgi:hypothetical protein